MSIPSVSLSRPIHSANWFMGVGVFDIVAGVAAVIWPGVTVLALALVFGFMILLAGIVSISIGLAIRRAGGEAWIPFLFGAAAAIAGIVCLVHPGAGVAAIVIGCALWFLFTGLGQLALARVRSPMRTWFLVMGIVSLIAFVLIAVEPGVGVQTVALIAGFSFLVRGFGEVALATRLRKLGA